MAVHEEMSSSNQLQASLPYINVLLSNGVKVKYELRKQLNGLGYEPSIVTIHTSPIELSVLNLKDSLNIDDRERHSVLLCEPFST